MTMELIQHIELGSAQPAIEFTNINSGYTDLYLVVSGRSSRSAVGDSLLFTFNGSTSNFSARWLEGDGATVASGTQARLAGGLTAASNTSNTFANIAIYIPNYRSSVAKSYSVDSVTENNATTAFQDIVAGLWNDTSPITSITLNPGTGPNFVAGSSATLYGIKKFVEPPAKATGGTMTYISGYWVHTFTASGTFTPTENLTNVEYLVIAGGGGGAGAFASSAVGGGGGAGGYRSSVVGQMSGGGASAEARLSLTSGVGYTVTVGAGGAGASGHVSGSNGSNSVFGSITATGGGGGGRAANADGPSGGLTGGSGGGAGATRETNTFYSGTSGGSGTANQGFAGSKGFGSDFTNPRAGSGGGAGGAAVNPGSGVAAIAGAGLSSNITGTAVVRAGGGGGASVSSPTQSGQNGGGNGASPSGNLQATSGSANTGGGGGGGMEDTTRPGAAGGSGIVIVRYPA